MVSPYSDGSAYDALVDDAVFGFTVSDEPTAHTASEAREQFLNTVRGPVGIGPDVSVGRRQPSPPGGGRTESP